MESFHGNATLSVEVITLPVSNVDHADSNTGPLGVVRTQRHRRTHWNASATQSILELAEE